MLRLRRKGKGENMNIRRLRLPPGGVFTAANYMFPLETLQVSQLQHLLRIVRTKSRGQWLFYAARDLKAAGKYRLEKFVRWILSLSREEAETALCLVMNNGDEQGYVYFSSFVCKNLAILAGDEEYLSSNPI